MCDVRCGVFCRMTLMQVDSVQRWMDDLLLMTECECMCILQSKPISVDDDSQTDLMFSSQDSTQNSLEMLLRRAWIISTELTKIVQKLEKNRWKRVYSMSIRTDCHVRSMIKEYNMFSRTSADRMHEVRWTLSPTIRICRAGRSNSNLHWAKQSKV